MNRAILALLLLVIATQAQFGRNKVQVEKFRWEVLRSTHFDIHHHQGGRELALHTAESLEVFVGRVAERTGMVLRSRVPILIHNSHPQFQQTNVLKYIIPEGVGGFTEVFKNRIVLPWQGSYPEFDHVLAHELVHAFMFDEFLAQGGSTISALMGANFPMWFNEGLAEFASLGWDRESDMYMVDAVCWGYVSNPTRDFGGFQAYKGGQSFLLFLENAVGPGTVRRLTRRALDLGNLPVAFREVVGVDLEEAGEIWLRQLRAIYWPELGRRQQAREVGRRLTDRDRDGSNWNMQPVLSPDGKRIAWLSDRGVRQGLHVGAVSDLPRRAPRKITEGGGTPTHESFQPFHSSVGFSPGGDTLVVASVTDGRSVLLLLDSRTGRTRGVLDPDLDLVASPIFAPDGRRIAFRGLLDGRADLWIWERDLGFRRLTNDRASDDHPAFSPSGRWLAFSSDRDGPTGGDSPQSSSDVYLLDLEDSLATPLQLTMDPHDDAFPSFGGTDDSTGWIAFRSDRSGLPQAYLLALSDTVGSERPVTNLLTGVFMPRLSADGSKLVLSLFERGGWEIYLLENPASLRTDSLPLTRFAQYGPDSLFRPMNREVLMTFRPDTLRHADSVRADSLQQDAIRRGPENLTPLARRDRLFSDPAPPPPRRPTPRTVDTAAIFPPSLPLRDSLGQVITEPYRTRWSIDNAVAQLGFSNLDGTAGQGVIQFSDLVGDQELAVSLAIHGSIEDAMAWVRYAWLPWRTDLAVAAWHQRYLRFGRTLSADSATFLADRDWGAALDVRHPFSVFHRLDGSLVFTGIDREAVILTPQGGRIADTTRDDRDESLFHLAARGAWVFDNALWGPVSPSAGTRARIQVGVVPRGFASDDLGFMHVRADVRRYVPLGSTLLHALALRASAGISEGLGGRNPERFLLGGDDFDLNFGLNASNLGSGLADIHFASFETPLRGYPYAQFRGSRFAAVQAELRVPLIEEIRFGILLPPLRLLMGIAFVDAGAAWSAGDWRDQGGVGAGWGTRLNLGIFVLRQTAGWPLVRSSPGGPDNTPSRVRRGARHHWSLGADF